MFRDLVHFAAAFSIASLSYLVATPATGLPQAKEAAHGDEAVLAVIRAVEENQPHLWRKGLSLEERQKIDDFYKERYDKK